MAYKPIEDHGVIGNLHTVALVGINGCVDFMCFPHFDSPSVFASLLDHRSGGRFQIAPVLKIERHKQFYLPNTNVLLTRFLSSDGIAELTDFMPVDPSGPPHRLVRQLKNVRGDITYRMVCAPRFDYGRARHRVERRPEGVLFESEGPDRTVLFLQTSCPVEIRDGAAVCEFTLKAGDHVELVLTSPDADGGIPALGPDYATESFKNTVNFWRRWIGRSTYRGRWREIVNRSALLLKLLSSERHGSIVAAPTFGLPETIGGVRNWDYRYNWIRDASFTSYAFIRLGFYEEAQALFRWIEARCEHLGPDVPLRIVYALDGGQALDETVLDHLEGYKGSAPVRIGNAAHGQLQLDIYGALIDSVYLYDKYGQAIHHDLWANIVRLVEWVGKNWRRPDEGVWEVRNERKEFLYSRVMCWVALDRAVRLARQRSLPADLPRWLAARDEVYHDIFDNFFDRNRRTFVQHRGSKTVDASALIMPLVRIVSATDPRWLSTLQGFEVDLVEDSFVYRYKLGKGASDGLPGDEGTFSMCTFWYVECLSRAGDLEKARLCFEKMVGHANHVGLYGEELGPCGEHLGNFPQALTHLALISAAYDLERRLEAADRGRPR